MSKPSLAIRRAVTYGLGPAQSYARFHDEVASRELYDISGIGPRFYFGWDALVMPDASLTRFDAVGLSYARDAARIRADGFEDLRIQLTHKGGFTGRLGEADVVVGAGTAVLVDQSSPFFNDSADTIGRTISLPRAAFGRDDVRKLHGRVVSGAAFHRLNDYYTWLLGALPGAPLSARDRVLGAMASVVRATFDPRGEAELQDGGALDGMAITRLRALALDRRFSEGRGAGELARTVGVSRSALYRAAAPLGGVMEVVWAARLDAAHGALLDAAQLGRVADVAAAFGFADSKHFQRRFRARFGFNPSDLRPIRG